MRVLERDVVPLVPADVAQGPERVVGLLPRVEQSGDERGRSFTHVGLRLAWPWSDAEEFFGLVSGNWCCSYIWKNIALSDCTSGTSRPSIQTTGLPVVLPWSCQAQLGVRMRSPGSM
jgi:hypothetical protein